MRPDVLTLAARLAERREPFVLATVVRRVAASAAQAGDAALVTASGEFHGWLGGSCTQPVVIREALAALADGEPRMIALSPNPAAESRPGVRVFPMTCHSGGTVDIALDPVLPARRLIVFGHSPISRALARAAVATGFAVEAADREPSHDAFPEGVRVVSDYASLVPSTAPAGGDVAVATPGRATWWSSPPWAKTTRRRSRPRSGSRRGTSASSPARSATPRLRTRCGRAASPPRTSSASTARPGSTSARAHPMRSPSASWRKSWPRTGSRPPSHGPRRASRPRRPRSGIPSAA